MGIYQRIIHVIGLIFLLLAVSFATARQDRPNILFIYTDDQSHRTLSCYAEDGARPWVNTPNIDRLSEEGVRFTNAYGASWCSPSRASVLTGLLPHGVEGVDIASHQDRNPRKPWSVKGNAIDRKKAKMWPVLLRESGYESGMIGKWHLGQDAGHGWLWDYSAVWDQNTPSGDWYNDQFLSFNGEAPTLVPGYSTDVYTELAKEFIMQSREKPWFLWLNYNAPHLPNTVHPRHEEQYAGSGVPIPADVFGPRPDKPEYMKERSMFVDNPDGPPIWYKWTLPTLVRQYNRLVSAVDDGVGDLLEALESSNQLQDTLIIFTSDQGFAWGEHGFAWKVGPYDACLKMPLIFRFPAGVAQGVVSDQPVTIVDVPPTLLSIAGVETPWEMHGYDLVPVLKNEKLEEVRPIFMENTNFHMGEASQRVQLTEDERSWKGVPWWFFVREGRYKYIRTHESGDNEELYDLEEDPEELRNLAKRPDYIVELRRLRRVMENEMKRTNASFDLETEI